MSTVSSFRSTNPVALNERECLIAAPLSPSVRLARLHLAVLSLRPHIPPPHHGNQKDLQAAAGQGHVPGEEPGLLLEHEERGATGATGATGASRAGEGRDGAAAASRGGRGGAE